MPRNASLVVHPTTEASSGPLAVNNCNTGVALPLASALAHCLSNMSEGENTCCRGRRVEMFIIFSEKKAVPRIGTYLLSYTYVHSNIDTRNDKKSMIHTGPTDSAYLPGD